ncbi:hypothetical protein [Conexibacter sp. DBS9H8]|uniref:hypothetical protein n=1 Tax=Conexibacter sp. DBS9H8 TaxID=2937801 RepID=UPI00200CE1F5|nr:hypothetical protein [Conexibacter sp. DBS9H8]
MSSDPGPPAGPRPQPTAPISPDRPAPVRPDRAGIALDRLRAPEWLIGALALALLVDVLALPWYHLAAVLAPTAAGLGAATSATGVAAHALIGPYALLVGLLGLTVGLAQAARPAPAVPVCLTVILLLAALVLTAALLIRVVLLPPHLFLSTAASPDSTRTGVPAVAGLFIAAALCGAAGWSLRVDGIAAADAPAAIETLALTRRPG